MADMSPHAVEAGAGRKKNRWYAAFLNSFFSIAFALLAGMRVDRAIQYFRADKDYWQFEAFMGLAYLVFSIVWMTRLRANWDEDERTR